MRGIPRKPDLSRTVNLDSVPGPCVCTTVRRAARVLARTYDASLASSGMNIKQLAVMRTLRRHPEEPLSRVAEGLAMDRTSLYRALAPLRRKKWIEIRDGGDGRSRSAYITEMGHAALEKANSGWASSQSAIIDRFGQTSWKTFVAELQRLTECANIAASVRSHVGERLPPLAGEQIRRRQVKKQ